MTEEQKAYRKEVSRLVLPMEHLSGFPRTKEGLGGYVDCICRIIQDQMTVTAIQSAEWLIEEAQMSFDRLPPVSELYEIYRKKYRPADQGPVPVVKKENL